MNKEPISLYIFRFILGFGLFAFMAMLYWSSALIENQLKFLRQDLIQIKNDIYTVRSETEKIRTDILKTLINHPLSQNSSSSETANFPLTINKKAAQGENLLKVDPFYQITLPRLLGPQFTPQGVRKEATFRKPDHLHPFSPWLEVSSWNDLCSISLASQEVGKYETMAPEMAERIELRTNEKGLSEYWVFLRQDVFWAPLQQNQFAEGIILAPHFLRRHPVTAHDFKFYFDAIMNPYVEEAKAVSLRIYFGDIEEIKILDDYTFIVRWKTEKTVGENGKEELKMKYLSKSWTGSLCPLASFVYQYFADGTKIIEEDSHPNTYQTNSIWAQNFSHHWAKNVIVSCGPWLFDGMTEREIRFKRNPDYFNAYAALTEALEFKFKNSPDGIWEEFKTDSLDLFEIPPNQLAELDRFLQSAPYAKQKENGSGIHRLDYISRKYYYIGWNQANPLFKSKKVRQALTMAIDRERIIRQNLNGMGMQTTGTFFPFSPSYDATLKPYPFNIQKALELLREDGWYDSSGTGVLEKVIDGQRTPFKFTLTYFVKSPTNKSICEYISTALKEIGIVCKIEGVDVADLSAIVDDKSFDAIYMAWALGSPPEDPRQLWYSTGAKEKGSSNLIGFVNQEVDHIIDKLTFEYDVEKRIELYHQFDRIIYDEAPYTFIYTPKETLLYRDYLQNVFIPAERQDLIPGANVGEPIANLFWIKDTTKKQEKYLGN